MPIELPLPRTEVPGEVDEVYDAAKLGWLMGEVPTAEGEMAP